MYPNEFDQAVAEATGESLSEIRHRGFTLADPADANFDPEPDVREPLFIDWDEMDAVGL
ncbi:hypothetical protein [Bremerella sp. P1]|uniref:hypothetical protein n=1 Tax=Bremerella sp. P1 TaxID=3026424 RepID=UPI002367A22B|nr:hypothetical protein [Bremerella sp. P1]WDI43767.1 hypothetical protein PSR63_07380 [Bremerella sp. P1]